MMKIFLNGEPRDVTPGMTVAMLLESLELAGRRVAVEVNLEIVPRSTHAGHVLSEGDKVEIVNAIGGG